LRSADEGSTIFYTVSMQRIYLGILLTGAGIVYIMQAWVAGEQLGYTYTPTEQKRATTPKPPRMLARVATRGSLRATLSFGRLERALNTGCDLKLGLLTSKSKRQVRK